MFIHHSVGGQLLADRGPLDAQERLSIHRQHPNGGGLRTRLERAGYLVNEASYGSALGQRTDLFDWLPKFRASMPELLANDVILFKSCYPNSRFRPGTNDGLEPPDPAGPLLTLANAQASFAALRQEFAAHPQVLFVYLTAPPLLARPPSAPLWKRAARALLGRSSGTRAHRESAAIARAFNDWLKSPGGWLAGYRHRNIAVFDYFDILTGGGRSNFLEFASNSGTDNHPSSEAQQTAASQLAESLSQALQRAQIR
jgi:hypothetical protein